MNKAIFTETINPLSAPEIPEEFIMEFQRALLKGLYDLGTLNQYEYEECLRRL